MRGRHLPSPHNFLELTYVFWLSVSMQGVTSKCLFKILNYINVCVFHIYFILFSFYGFFFLEKKENKRAGKEFWVVMEYG